MTQSKEPRPLLTIAITCYNAESSIRRALDSALAQTWTPREIVVVDDGSTDRSGVVLEEVERTHDEVLVIRHSSNRGVAEARNTLLAQAQGTFIAFFDDDDESAPDRLEAQYRRVSDYESDHAGAAVFCYSNRLVVRTGEEHATCGPVGIGRLILHHRARELPTTCWVYSAMTVGIRGACSGAVRSWRERKCSVLWAASMGDFVAALNATLRSELRCGVHISSASIRHS